MQTAIADGYQEMFTKLDLTRVDDKMELIKLLAERDFYFGSARSAPRARRSHPGDARHLSFGDADGLCVQKKRGALFFPSIFVEKHVYLLALRNLFLAKSISGESISSQQDSANPAAPRWAMARPTFWLSPEKKTGALMGAGSSPHRVRLETPAAV